MGTIMVATEPRFKLAIFHVGGFYFQRARPEVEAINFAPRVRVPELDAERPLRFFFPGRDLAATHVSSSSACPSATNAGSSTTPATGCLGTRQMKETLAWLDRRPSDECRSS